MSLAVTAGARIPHTGGDPYGADVILLMGLGDFVDHSPLHLGTVVPAHQSLDPSNPLGGESSILSAGLNTQSGSLGVGAGTLTPPFICELWFKCAPPGDGFSRPIFSGRDVSSHGPFFYITGVGSLTCQWSWTRNDGTGVVIPSQAPSSNTWVYTALLVDQNHSCGHIGLQGGMTLPSALTTGAGAGNPDAFLGPSWFFAPPNGTVAYAGNYAQIRVTRATTRGLSVDDGHGNGVPFAVPNPPFPIP